MNGPGLRLALFVVLAVVQLAAAAGAILRSEVALRTGQVFLFELQPVDPVDAFRGRYVALRFTEDHAPVATGLPTVNRQRVFVPLTVDDEGFAILGAAAVTRPNEGAYLRLRTGGEYTDEDGRRVVFVALPFSRYYMTEELARDVDRSMWRGGQRPAWVSVRVWGGTAVVEELFIDGRPVREWLAEGGAERPPASR